MYSSGSLLIKGMSLISAPIYTRIFDPAGYGVLSFINVLVAFLTGILLLGGDNAYTRFYFLCKTEQERQTLSATWFMFLALWSIPVMTSVLPFSPQISLWLTGSADYRLAVAAGFLSAPLLMMNLILSQALRNRFQAGAFTVLNVITALLTLGLAVMLIVIFDLGVAGALFGAAGAALVMLPVRLFFIRDLLVFRFSGPMLKKLLVFGLPLVPMNVAFWLLSNADRLMLAHLATLEEVGFYSIAAAMCALLMLLQTAVGQSWLPHAVRVYEENREMAAEVFKKTMVYLLVISGFVITAFTALAQEVLFILVPEEYYPSFAAVPFLAAGFLFFTTAQVSSAAIMVKNKTVYIMLACWFAAVVNILLNLALIPPFGMTGAGAATGMSYFLFAVTYFLVARRFWIIAYPARTVACLLALPLAAILIIGLVGLHGPGLLYNFIMKLLLLVFTGAGLLYIYCREEGGGFRYLAGKIVDITKKMG